MVTARYHKVKFGEHELNADTLMLGYGYTWLLQLHAAKNGPSGVDNAGRRSVCCLSQSMALGINWVDSSPTTKKK